MSEKIKNYLGVAIIITILGLAVAALMYVNSYVKNSEPASFRSFAVSGEGKSVGVPDVAEFTFSVITEGGKDVASLQKQNTEKVNKILAFIKASGVEAKDIKTQNYSVEPRYQYFNCPGPIYSNVPSEPKPCPPPEISGYTINQTDSVKVRKFETVGDLLGGVVKNGANSVSQLSFKVDDPTSVQNEARAEAFQKAKDKAQALAKAGGFRLGRLLSIEEGANPQPIYYDKYATGAGGGYASAPAAVPPPNIEPGSQEVTIDITLHYEIE